MSRARATFPIWLRTVGDRVKGVGTVQSDPAGTVVLDLPFDAVMLLGMKDQRSYRVTLTKGQAGRLLDAVEDILDALESQEAAA